MLLKQVFLCPLNCVMIKKGLQDDDTLLMNFICNKMWIIIIDLSDMMELAELSCLITNAVQVVLKIFYVLVVFLLSKFMICYWHWFRHELEVPQNWQNIILQIESGYWNCSVVGSAGCGQELLDSCRNQWACVPTDVLSGFYRKLRHSGFTG